MSGNAANFYNRRGGRKGQHHRHLQKHAEKIADIVSRMFGKSLGAVAALQQECLTSSNLGKLAGQLARLASKNQRRKTGELTLDIGKRAGVGIVRVLLDRLRPPAVRGPFAEVRLGHSSHSMSRNGRPDTELSAAYTRGF